MKSSTEELKSGIYVCVFSFLISSCGYMCASRNYHQQWMELDSIDGKDSNFLYKVKKEKTLGLVADFYASKAKVENMIKIKDTWLTDAVMPEMLQNSLVLVYFISLKKKKLRTTF